MYVQPLALNVNVFGVHSIICPVLIGEKTGATLVDAGYPGSFGQIRDAVEQAGVPFGKVKRVIITHHDWDHIGTLPEMLQVNGSGLKILAHSGEVPYIDGSIAPLKLTPERIAARIAALPETERERAAAVFANLPQAPVHQVLADGEMLPFHGGIEVIHTPGHSPGHICLYLKTCKILISGDLLRVDQGVLNGPVPEYTPDMFLAQQSLKKIAGYNFSEVICYHGGVYNTGTGVRVAELAVAER
ncbi:MAG TPA: MBL fold metallo-hydrolase [Patescibacteria group bacterium]|nr:MBL fold metallo-hydrolase [Patescibacteria group bacterium]